MHVDIILNEFCSPRETAELSQLAERYGVRAVWSSNYPSERNAFLSLALAAGATKRVRLGPLAVSPFELHPLIMGNALLTLNEMCGGRATIGIGGGGGTLGAMGMARSRLIPSVGDCLEILKAATTQDVVDYQGEVYRVINYRPRRWARQAPPQIYLCAEKPRMIDLATRLADGLMRGDCSPAIMRGTVSLIDEGLAAHGRTRQGFGISNFWAWHVKKDKAAAWREARRELVLRGMIAAHYTEAHLSKDDSDFVQSHKRAFWQAFRDRSGDIKGVPERIVATLVDKMSSTGDMSDLDREIERMKEFEAAGLTEIALRVHDDPADAIRIIGEHVVPAVQ